MKVNINNLTIKYFFYTILLSSFVSINSIIDDTNLKIGIKNKYIEIIENQTIYRINTNYFYLNIALVNLKNITNIIITDKIIPKLSPFNNISYSNPFGNCKFYYI